jgi:2-alkenal reductase
MQKLNGPRSSLLIMSAVLAGVMGGGAAGGLVGYFASHMPSPVASNVLTATGTTTPTSREEMSVVNAIRKVSPAVVTIVNEGVPSPGMAGTIVTTVLSGSGLIFDPSGLIVTNNHVVQRARLLQVIFSDGTKTEGTVVGTDSVSDIAVIKVSGPLTMAVPLGNSNGLELGLTVIAIGSPIDQFRGTTTVGVVSGLDRSVGGMSGLIQTDAPINYGDSGGPLLNASGEVIGINTLVVRSTGDGKILEALGFAIPSNQVRAIVEQILSNSDTGPPVVGINYQEVDLQVASALHLDTDSGIVITQVEASSPAARAGLQEKDVILAVNRQKITRDHLFSDAISNYKPGDTVTLTVIRNGQQLQIALLLGHRP